jgi:hypothetical protein
MLPSRTFDALTNLVQVESAPIVAGTSGTLIYDFAVFDL